MRSNALPLVFALLAGPGCSNDVLLGMIGCTAGSTQTCGCPSTGTQGSRACRTDQTWEDCRCANPQPDAGAEVALAWSSRAPMPTPRYDFAAAVLNGQIYVAGGTSGSTLAVLERYDPASDRWTRLADMPMARRRPVAGTADGKLYVGLGYTCLDVNSCTYFNSLDVYDPTTDTWSPGPGLSFGKYSAGDYYGGQGYYWVHGMTVLHQLYLLANATTGQQPTGPTAYAFDPFSSTWSVKTPFPFVWFDAEIVESAELSGRGYSAGGSLDRACEGPEGEAPFAIYNPGQDVWTLVESVPTMPQGLGATGTRVYAVGGRRQSSSGDCVASGAVYAWSGSAWQTATAMTSPRYVPKAIGVGNTLYVVGGATRSGVTLIPSAEVEAGVER